MSKQLSFDEFERLGNVTKVVHAALLAILQEISNKDGKVKNARTIRSIDKTHSIFCAVKEGIEKRFRSGLIKTPPGKTKSRSIYHGPVMDNDLEVFVEFMRGYIEQRK